MRISLPESKFNEMGYNVAYTGLDGSVKLVPMVTLEDELYDVLGGMETTLNAVATYAPNSEAKQHLRDSVEAFRQALKKLDIEALDEAMARAEKDFQ